MKHMKSSSERHRISCKIAILDVWILWLGALLDLDNRRISQLSIPKTGGWFLWTRKDRAPQCAHISFPVSQNGSCGYFMIATSATETPFLMCPASHTYGFNPRAAKKQLVRVLKLEQTIISLWPVFGGHGFLQHADAAYKGSRCLHYYSYFSPLTCKVHEVVIFPYEDSMKEEAYSFKMTVPK